MKTLHNLQMQVFPCHNLIFSLNSASVLEYLIFPSVIGTTIGDLCTEYSLVRMLLSLVLATANNFHFSNCMNHCQDD